MGKFKFNRVPFGLAQAPANFQRLINEVLTDCNFAMGYLDDIIIFSKNEEEHLQHLEEIFECLQKAGLKLKLQKCSFFKKDIQYLGHLTSDEGIQPLPEKLPLILRYPEPTADYILYTDPSKYAYAGVLTQSIDGTDHPVAYTSGLFRGSQLNWAALTEEAYAIYTCQ